MSIISSLGKGAFVGVGALSLVASTRDYQADKKTHAFLKATFGVACLAIAYWGDSLLESFLPPGVHATTLKDVESSSIVETVISNPSSSDQVFATTTAAPACPLDRLNDLLKEEQGTLTERTCLNSYFDELKQSHAGISCKNFVRWQDSFSSGGTDIDGIRKEDVKHALSWSIAPGNTPVMILKHACANGDIGVAAIFKKSDLEQVVVKGNFIAKCFLKDQSICGETFDWLTFLLRGRPGTKVVLWPFSPAEYAEYLLDEERWSEAVDGWSEAVRQQADEAMNKWLVRLAP